MNTMKPSQLSTILRRIAAKIDSSRNPSRILVERELRRILAAMAPDGGSDEDNPSEKDMMKNRSKEMEPYFELMEKYEKQGNEKGVEAIRKQFPRWDEMKEHRNWSKSR